MPDEDSPDAESAVEEKEPINPKARPGTFKSIKLDKPIETGGEEIYFLDFREPTVKDLRKYGATGQMSVKGSEQHIKFDMDIIALYIEKLCALAKDDANKLSMADFEKAKEIVLVFFPVI